MSEADAIPPNASLRPRRWFSWVWIEPAVAAAIVIGLAPQLNVTYDGNNHQVGGSYDGNGNQTSINGTTNGYSVENRLETQSAVASPHASTLSLVPAANVVCSS